MISFRTYVLDFNQLNAAPEGANHSPKEVSTAFLLFGPRTDRFFVVTPPEEVRTEIYRRFSDWLYPLVYGTIAVFFAVVFVALFFAVAFLADFLAPFFAGPLARRSASSSAARSRLIDSTESPWRRVAPSSWSADAASAWAVA